MLSKVVVHSAYLYTLLRGLVLQVSPGGGPKSDGRARPSGRKPEIKPFARGVSSLPRHVLQHGAGDLACAGSQTHNESRRFVGHAACGCFPQGFSGEFSLEIDCRFKFIGSAMLCRGNMQVDGPDL